MKDTDVIIGVITSDYTFSLQVSCLKIKINGNHIPTGVICNEEGNSNNFEDILHTISGNIFLWPIVSTLTRQVYSKNIKNINLLVQITSVNVITNQQCP